MMNIMETIIFDDDGAFIFSVGALMRSIREGLEGLFPSVAVAGEISRVTITQNGHAYFSLKDETAVLDCAMFAGARSSLAFVPEQNMRVIVYGRVTAYEKRGQMQLVVYAMKPEGAGILALAFERLKTSLKEKGYFDEARKRPLPQFPRAVGVVTSPTGAALRDILSVSKRRAPSVDIVVYPALVQGEGAKESIANMIEIANQRKEVDLLIVGRGGGSLEDLWAFNEEVVANAIVESALPIVSAVGHETDLSIADLAADLRAATPSAAAELVFPNEKDAERLIVTAERRMIRSIEHGIARANERYTRVTERVLHSATRAVLEEKHKTFNDAETALREAMDARLHALNDITSRMSEKLSLLSPLNTLKRGYAAIKKNNRYVKRKKDVKKGEDIAIQFYDGTASARIE